MNKTIRIILLVVAIVVSVYLIANALNFSPTIVNIPVSTTTSSVPVTSHPIASEGDRCGGNMTNAPICGSGLHCTPESGSHLPFGDVGGTCVKDVVATSTLGVLLGKMTIAPVCPVERADTPCKPTASMYASHTVFVYTSDRSKLVTTLTPDENGAFSTTLPSGKYLIDTAHSSVGSVKITPQILTIKTNSATTVSITIDTGIR